MGRELLLIITSRIFWYFPLIFRSIHHLWHSSGTSSLSTAAQPPPLQHCLGLSISRAMEVLNESQQFIFLAPGAAQAAFPTSAWYPAHVHRCLPASTASYLLACGFTKRQTIMDPMCITKVKQDTASSRIVF